MAGTSTNFHPQNPLADAERYIWHYYNVLNKNPANVQQYFRDTSTVIRINGITKMTANTTPEIMELISTLSNEQYLVMSNRCLGSWEFGSIVLVWGSIRNQNFVMQQLFVEMFLLAKQEQHYFILASVFGYGFQSSQNNPYELLSGHYTSYAEVLEAEIAHEGPMASYSGSSVGNRGIYIRNLPGFVDNNKLTEIIQPYGIPKAVKVEYDSFGQSKGYAFVTMRSASEHEAVIRALHRRVYEGGELIVKDDAERLIMERLPNTLHISNLKETITACVLRECFGEYGILTDTIVPLTVRTKKHHGYGFVSFQTIDEMRAALAALHGEVLNGRKMWVAEANTNRSL